MIPGITHIENFIDNPSELFTFLTRSVIWDESMAARKTASFGKAYNYSQMSYPFQEFPAEIAQIIQKLTPAIGFEANNCLINYYLDGKSKMGFHSDTTDILEENTGIAIISVGETKTLKFKNIAHPEHMIEYNLNPGSLVYMTIALQSEWQHAIPKSDTENGRISLTFRKLK